jgi:predicted HTH transcriptional regulator
MVTTALARFDEVFYYPECKAFLSWLLHIHDLIAMRVTPNPRNQVLAGFLRDIPGYMERVGSGVRFMIQEMREMGLPDLEFSEYFDGSG